LATSGGGHTLRSHDLVMILAWHRNTVSYVGHSADVMKKMDGVGRSGPEGRALEINCGDAFSIRECQELGNGGRGSGCRGLRLVER